MAKFSQRKELRDILLATGEAKLVENTTNDACWGDGGDGYSSDVKIGSHQMHPR